MKNITWQRTFSLAQLLLGLALAVFIAGIVVPSLLRSGIATREALAAGSLHALKVASVTFLFTYKNLVAAILGVLIGGSAALAIEVGSARIWLSHAYALLQACLENWSFGVTGGKSASTYIKTRMSRQAVPVVHNVRFATVCETEGDRWVA